MSSQIIELCAGTSAVSFSALGAPRFPASRIGSKLGYVDPILEALGLARGAAEHAVLVESDCRLASVLDALFSDPENLAIEVESFSLGEARAVWEKAKAGDTPAHHLIWFAGARGGIGGFKGKHKLRPSVDGFIPSRESLVKRCRSFSSIVGLATVINADVSGIDATSFSPTSVYIDPPYVGRQGYTEKLSEPVERLALRWAAAGHRVVVSEARRLVGATSTEVTNMRKGQSRESMTTCAVEWINLFMKRDTE